MSLFGDSKCATCGKPATNATMDLLATGVDSEGWATFDPYGDQKFGCKEHPAPPSKTFRYDGDKFVEMTDDPIAKANENLCVSGAEKDIKSNDD